MYKDVILFMHGLSCRIVTNSIIVDEDEIKELIKNIIKKVSEWVWKRNI